jgi:threonine dehydrogenase-like Zn-dependent dehydrogenase
VEATIRLIESGRLKLRKKIAGQFALEEYSDAINLAKENRGWENIVLMAP